MNASNPLPNDYESLLTNAKFDQLEGVDLQLAKDGKSAKTTFTWQGRKLTVMQEFTESVTVDKAKALCQLHLPKVLVQADLHKIGDTSSKATSVTLHQNSSKNEEILVTKSGKIRKFEVIEAKLVKIGESKFSKKPGVEKLTLNYLDKKIEKETKKGNTELLKILEVAKKIFEKPLTTTIAANPASPPPPPPQVKSQPTVPPPPPPELPPESQDTTPIIRTTVESAPQPAAPLPAAPPPIQPAKKKISPPPAEGDLHLPFFKKSVESLATSSMAMKDKSYAFQFLWSSANVIEPKVFYQGVEALKSAYEEFSKLPAPNTEASKNEIGNYLKQGFQLQKQLDSVLFNYKERLSSGEKTPALNEAIKEMENLEASLNRMMKQRVTDEFTSEFGRFNQIADLKNQLGAFDGRSTSDLSADQLIEKGRLQTAIQTLRGL